MTLSELATMFRPLGKTFIAAQAKIPHVRLYFGEDYAMLRDDGDGLVIDWSSGISENKLTVCLAKIKEKIHEEASECS